jgi:hypothetical protein
MNCVPTSEPPRLYWHEGLQCHIDRIDYDFRTGAARLFLPTYNVTSMTGALKLGTAVDPRCRLIHVYSAGKMDYAYRRFDEDRWRCCRYSDVRREAAHDGRSA